VVCGHTNELNTLRQSFNHRRDCLPLVEGNEPLVECSAISISGGRYICGEAGLEHENLDML